MTASAESTGQLGQDSDPEPAEPELAEPEPVGIAGEVSSALSELADRPVEEHPAVYEDIHRRLGHTLSGIDHV